MFNREDDMAHGRASLCRERWKGVNKGYVSFKRQERYISRKD